MQTLSNQTKPFLTFEQAQIDDNTLTPIAINGAYKLSELYSFTLLCAVQQDAMTALFEKEETMLYQPISVQLLANEQSERYFHGVITAIQFDIDNQQCTFTIEPALAKAKQTLRNRVFNHQSILNVVQTIIAEQTKHTDTYFKLNISNSISNNKVYDTQKPLIMQYQETDYDFIARLLAQIGIFYHFEFQKNQHIMHLNSDQNNLPFYNNTILRDTHAQRADQSIYNWQEVNTVSTDNIIVDDYDPNHVQNKLQSGTIDNIKTNYQVFPGGYTTKSEGELLADNLANAFQTQSHYFIAKTGNLDIHPGSCIQVENEQGNIEKYFIVYQQYTAKGHAPHTKRSPSNAQNSFQSTIHVVPFDQTYKPICTHQKPTIYGLQTATVITPTEDNSKQGEPIYTNEDAKVKIRFMWEDPKHTADNAAWVRVMQSSAGKHWGMLFTPRKDDEVLVSFQNGDIDLPIIVGSAYNSAHPPAYDLQKSPYTTGIKMASISKETTDPTRSNELIFNNEIDKENITLKAQRDYVQVIENNATTIVTGQSTTAVQHGDMIIDVEKGALLAQASNKVTLQVGASQIVIDSSGINIIAPTIQLNPPGSSSATAAGQQARSGQSDKEKTTQAVDNDTSSSSEG